MIEEEINKQRINQKTQEMSFKMHCDSANKRINIDFNTSMQRMENVIKKIMIKYRNCNRLLENSRRVQGKCCLIAN
jgi:hypothetical protein